MAPLDPKIVYFEILDEEKDIREAAKHLAASADTPQFVMIRVTNYRINDFHLDQYRTTTPPSRIIHGHRTSGYWILVPVAKREEFADIDDDDLILDPEPGLWEMGQPIPA